MTDTRLNGWLGVELRYLVALRTVADERSFSGAAERLGYAQSAVSQQIVRLEQAVGVRLVDRTRGRASVGLTEAGTVVCEHAERIVAQLMAARTDLAALLEHTGETLSLGAFQSVAARVVPGALTLLRERQSGLRVVATEALHDRELFAKVSAGELDAAFAELPLPDGPFAHCVLFDDPCVLLVQAGSEIARRTEPLRHETIAALPLVELPAWRMNEGIDAEFCARGLQLRYALRSETNTAVHALVSAGLGAAIVPRLAVDDRDPGVVALPLSDLLPSRTLVLYWHRDRRDNPALEAFRHAVLSTCAERFGGPGPG